EHAGGRSMPRLSRAALGAAVTLIIAVTAGCGTPAATSQGGTGTATTPATITSGNGAGTAPPSSGLATSPASRASRPTGSSPGASQPAGGPVPPGFVATSVTLVSTQEAFVLGTAPCAHAPCTSILRTLDRGATWRGLPAPVAPIGHPGGSNGSSASP